MLLSALLAVVSLAVIPSGAGAKPKTLHLRIRLVLADGAQVTGCSYGALRLEALAPKGDSRRDRALPLDASGEAELLLRRPGGYRLRLMGMPLARFKVVQGEAGLEARGLPQTIKLPFTHILVMRPPRRMEKYRDPRTGKERTRTSPAPIDWSRVRVGSPGRESLARVWPYKNGKFVAGVAAPKGGAAWVAAPGCAPVVAPLRPIAPDRAGDLGRRQVGVTLIPINLSDGEPKRIIGAPFGYYVHNVKKQVLWWVRKLRVGKREFRFLLSYRFKGGMGRVVPLRLPSPSGRAGDPKLYLDEKGELHAFRQLRGPEGKALKQCFTVADSGAGTVTPECLYPYFRFHGQVYGNYGIWVIPNIGGVPLMVGSNSVSVQGTVEVGGRTTSVAQSYTVNVEGPLPHVTGKVPSTRCTGTPPMSGHSDDNRWCLDPEVSPSFYKGPPPSMPPDCNKSKPCREEFRKKLAAWQSYHPQPPCYGDMVQGKASFGGVDLTYAGPVEFNVPTDFGPQGQPLSPVKKRVVLSGLPPLRPNIHLLDAGLGWSSLQGPLNLQQGPFAELRYRAKRVDPATRRTSSQYEVVKVYPWNYRVRTEGREIIVDRSAMLKPTPPPAGEQDQNEAGALLEVLSPQPDERHPLTGPEAEVRIKLRYDLAGAAKGVLRVSADHDSGALYRHSFALAGPGGEREIAFVVRQPKGSQQIGVGMELIPAGADSGPFERLYYYFPAGAFSVEATTEKPVAAHPKNQTRVTLTIKDSAGKPLANREFTVHLVDPHLAWLRGGYLERLGGASTRVTTDAEGRASVLYIPPQAAKSASGASLGSFPVQVEMEVRDAADSAQTTRAVLKLVSPWPRISKLALPGGDLAGHWQGSDSRVVVADADSQSFDITIYGPGEFGYRGGHGRQEKLEVLDAASPFHFRFKSRPLGLNLGDIPSNWDMLKDFGQTNAKVLGRLALLFGGKWLLRQNAVTGQAKYVTHTSQVTKVSGSTGLVGLNEFDARIISKVKVMTKFKNALPQVTWATDLMGDADAAISITKNTAEVANALGQSRLDIATAGNLGPAHDLDAALDGMHAGVGVVDTFVTVKDMVTGSPLNLEVELAKGAYENAKMFYNWHRKFQTVADSWEDVTFVPILVEVTDREGHRARRLGRLAIKFSKEMGQQ